MRSVMSTRRPSKAEKNRVDIQSLDNILRSAGIHLSNEEMQEALRHVSVDADGRVNLSEFMQQVKTVQCTDQGAEKASPALGRVSKARVSKVRVLHPLPRKKVLKSILRKATREHSCITQRRSKSKTAKNLTKKQLEAFYDAFSFFPKDPGGNIGRQGLQETAKELGISLTTQEANRELAFADADRDGKVNFFDFLSIVTDKKRFMQAIVPEKKYRGKGDSASATGIVLFEVLSKLVELAALPQKTLLEIVRYYRQKFLRCTGQKAWKDSNNLMYCRKKHHRIIRRKDQACVSSFVNTARISFMNNKDLLAYVESLKGETCLLSPTPFPQGRGYKQDSCVPPSDSPYAQVPIFPLIPKQEVMIAGRPKKDLQKLERQRRSKPIASFENHFFQKRNWVQESKWLSQQYRQGLALHERARLLRLWRRLRGGRIGLETGNESFHHIFSTYSWSWNVCQELLTPDELRRADNELYRWARLRAGK
ncbi:EF-hand calcium-binding domain-containing protein 3 [Nothoprocta perdicaria]|uniref:EF-hand calcium-binding domain-containing protein 3 n=1 Tax=Nothoprocta perdicaria TaxID=30464 RepID=UPI000E1BAD28|nr:EF-hand calcium-binding domain-containing protein 3 [Nothoprocta perdicaria]